MVDKRLFVKFTKYDKLPVYVEVNQIVAVTQDEYDSDKSVIQTTNGRDLYILEPIDTVIDIIQKGWYLHKNNY